MTPTQMSIGDLASAGVLEFGDGYRTKRSEHGQPGYRIIRVADVLNGVVKLDGPDFVSEEYAGKIGPKIGQPGDILLTTKGTVGRVAVMPTSGDPVVYSPQLCFFRVTDNTTLNPGFLRYWFSSQEFWAQASYRMNNTDMAAYINMADIRSMEISLPSPGDQQDIVEVLGALDDKIAANTKLATICDNLALSTLHVCPASVPVGEIVTYKKGSIDVSTLGAPEVAHFSLPAFDSGKLPDLCNPDEIKSNKAHVQAPSVLISKLNPRFPRVWNLPKLPSEPAVASTEFLVLEPKFSSTSVLWAILSQEKFKRELETQVAGTSGSHQRVKPADLLATKVIDPRNLNSETQHLITSLCETSFHSQYENRHLEVTRDALLPQLMSGKLRVKDAEKVIEDAL